MADLKLTGLLRKKLDAEKGLGAPESTTEEAKVNPEPAAPAAGGLTQPHMCVVAVEAACW